MDNALADDRARQDVEEEDAGAGRWRGAELRAKLGSGLRRLGRGLVDIALPPGCMACRAAVSEPGCLCASCWRQIDFFDPSLDDRTRLEKATSRVRAAARFGPVARDLVHGLKYADRLDTAPPLGRLMARAGADILHEADALVPVPLHPLRLWKRRFNQSALLAQTIARECGVPMQTGWLIRRRATPPQVGLDREARAANVADAFAVPDGALAAVAGRRIVLVDDVLTTGATLNACVGALRQRGAGRVDVLVFARVVDGSHEPIS